MNNKNILLIFCLCVIGIGIQSAYASDSNIFVHKDISDTKFSWSEEVTITITIINIGSSNITDIHIEDDIPLGFTAESEDNNGKMVFSYTQPIEPGGSPDFTRTFLLSDRHVLRRQRQCHAARPPERR